MNDQEFSDILHLYRGVQPTGFDLHASVDLMDSSECQATERRLHLGGQRWERRKAVADLGTSLPEQRGLYMFVWKPDLRLKFDAPPAEERPIWVLYVGKAGIEDGKTDTIRHRYTAEYSKFVGGDPTCLWNGARSGDRRQQLLARYLALRPLEYWFLLVSDVPTIEPLERKLIHLLHPPVNTQHAGPKIRPGLTEPAF